MPRGFVRAFLIVGCDCVAAPVFWETVDAYDSRAHVAVRLFLYGEITERGGDHNEACRQISAQFVEVGHFFRMVVVGVAEKHSITIGEGLIFSSSNNGGKEWVGDIGNDHSDDVGLDAPQTAS